jgi:hypothetical protein
MLRNSASITDLESRSIELNFTNLDMGVIAAYINETRNQGRRKHLAKINSTQTDEAK